MDTIRLNLILSTPVIPKENILLIEGIHDLFADTQAIEELWQKWQPEIWRLPQGHVGAQFVLGLMGRVLRGLAPRLDKPFSLDRRTPPNKSLQPTAAPLLRSTVAANSDARCTPHRYCRRLWLSLGGYPTSTVHLTHEGVT